MRLGVEALALAAYGEELLLPCVPAQDLLHQARPGQQRRAWQHGGHSCFCDGFVVGPIRELEVFVDVAVG